MVIFVATLSRLTCLQASTNDENINEWFYIRSHFSMSIILINRVVKSAMSMNLNDYPKLCLLSIIT